MEVRRQWVILVFVQTCKQTAFQLVIIFSLMIISGDGKYFSPTFKKFFICIMTNFTNFAFITSFLELTMFIKNINFQTNRSLRYLCTMCSRTSL